VTEYPTIEKWSPKYFGKHIFAFDKCDGSNMRFEWNRKLSKKSRFTFGFKKFGTRTERIMNTSNPFYEGVKIFNDEYAELLDKIFIENKRFRNIEQITVFTEFCGKNSFAGRHDWKEKHYLKIFDINLYKKGFLSPAEFFDIFYIGRPALVKVGEFEEQFVKEIENNKYNLQEGVVCKGMDEGKVFMFKIKTQAWLDKVKKMYGEKEMLNY